MIEDKHLNSMGIVHGGAITSLADTAIGFGAFMAKKVFSIILYLKQEKE